MKTAVEWLQAEFNKWAEGRVFIPQDLLEEAKRLEKEHIIEAFEQGLEFGFPTNGSNYFNKTYNQNK